MYCGSCGKKLEKNEKFCKSCGTQSKPFSETLDEIMRDLRERRFDQVPPKINAIRGLIDPGLRNKIEGDLHFLHGRYEEAAACYSAIPKKERSWDTELNLGLIYLNSGEHDKAAENLKAASNAPFEPADTFIYTDRYRTKDSFLADVHMYLGVLYKGRGDIKNAVKNLERALHYSPGSEYVHANLGDLYLKEADYGSAVSHYNKAIEASTDPLRKSHLYNDMGLALLSKGDTADAVQFFKKAIMLNPENQNAVYNLGLVYVKSGMQDRIKDDYKEFLSHKSGVDIVFSLSKSMMDVARREQEAAADAGLIGDDVSMKKVKAVIAKAAASDSTVFIHGENGTGKELVARAIHAASRRADKPFTVVNCGALPETLLESELFGYEKGAFTGAAKTKPGRFEIADGGTVFLDEIGDITPAMQVKLLRFVQEREFERVGGNETMKVDVRIITATNRDIKELVKAGKFREDLFYRIYVLPVFMPPLRERGNDIKILAGHFLQVFSDKYGKTFTGIGDEALAAFNSYAWPGNIRELENVMERIVTLHEGGEVKPEFLPPEITAGQALPQALPETEGSEKERVLNALKKVNFSKTKAAALLGISRVALWKKIKKLNIS